MRGGISEQGFRRLASFVQAQAWGGDVLVVTANKWYTPPGGEGTTLGCTVDFSDGARGYLTTENFEHASLVVIDPQGQMLVGAEQVEGESSAWDAYFTAYMERTSSAPQGVLSMAEQEDFNSVMGTNYEVFEPTEEDIQFWSEGMEDAASGF